MEAYELTGADLLVVKQTCTIADQIEGLKPLLSAGWMFKDPNTGLPRVNPAFVQYRLLTDSMGKKMASIRIIGDVAGDDTAGRRSTAGSVVTSRVICGWLSECPAAAS